MLRDESPAKLADRPWTGSRKMMASLALLAATAAVASFRPPALADDANLIFPIEARPVSANPAPVCFGDNMDGVVTFRPAAAFRHPDLERLAVDLDAYAEKELIPVGAKALAIDPARPGFLRIGVRDIDWFSIGIGLDQVASPRQPGDKLHRLTFGGFAIRLAGPFDWLAFLRQWRLEVSEAGEPGQALYRLAFDGRVLPTDGGWPSFVHLPDDRTLLIGSESEIRAAMARGPAVPAILDQADWARVSQGLMGLTLTNRGGEMAKRFDLGRPDDAVFLSLFRGVERWTFAVEDAEPIRTWASAACVDGAAGSAMAVVVRALSAASRTQAKADAADLPAEPIEDFFLLLGRMIGEAEIAQDGPSVTVQFARLMSNAEFAEAIRRNFLRDQPKP